MQEIQFLNPGGLLSSESSQIYTQQIKSLPRSPQTKTKAVHSCKGQCHDICIASFFSFVKLTCLGPWLTILQYISNTASISRRILRGVEDTAGSLSRRSLTPQYHWHSRVRMLISVLKIALTYCLNLETLHTTYLHLRYDYLHKI